MSRLRFYNTLKREIQDFTPLREGSVSLYCCGPTVYNFAHIGNFRTYIFEDILVRTLRIAGYDVKHVMNITDIGHLSGDGDDGEDKMLKSAQERESTVLQIAQFFTKKFFEDAASLNINIPSLTCAATAHIQDMINMIEKIEAAGFTYQAGGNVYFDTAKYTQYGQLRGYGIKGGTHHRVDVDQLKKNPEDFVLWFTKSKFEEQALRWQSPWGQGYPGWHLECSAMSQHYLGEQIDIHCGGVDHISVHHTNEIAQNYACCGNIGAQIWMHGEFLTLYKEKMSKSADNFLTVDRLVELGFDPLDYRYLCLGTHYRKPLSFHNEAIISARQARLRLIHRVNDLQKEIQNLSLRDLSHHPYWQAFMEKLSNDLGCPEALAVLWAVLKDQGLIPSEKLSLLHMMDNILGLDLLSASVTKHADELEEKWMNLIRQREQVRKEKDYALSDQLRNELLENGIVIEDTPQGTIWKRK